MNGDSSPLTFNLTLLRPFMSKYHLVVTPLVALLNPAHTSVLSHLVPHPGEVERIFHHPLECVLDPGMLSCKQDDLAEKGGEDWPYEEDLYVSCFLLPIRWLASRIEVSNKQNCSDAEWAGFSYRMHRFRSAASPIKGLTSDILVSLSCQHIPTNSLS